jgi:hypothetical protein
MRRRGTEEQGGRISLSVDVTLRVPGSNLREPAEAAGSAEQGGFWRELEPAGVNLVSPDPKEGSDRNDRPAAVFESQSDIRFVAPQRHGSMADADDFRKELHEGPPDKPSSSHRRVVAEAKSTSFGELGGHLIRIQQLDGIPVRGEQILASHHRTD